MCVYQEEGERRGTHSHPCGARQQHGDWTLVVHGCITKVLRYTETTSKNKMCI